MAEIKGVLAALVTIGVVLLGLVLGSGVPLGAAIPPLWTIAAIVLAPLFVIAVSTFLPSSSLEALSGQRRAAAANTPGPRRNGGASVGSTPGRFGMGSISEMAFELPDGPTR